ncbi:InlB B-repeat-containing protein [Hespellia stercorisuis]|nr:InlB B-repeat-containing protein [Hespellia stercorisuis]
MCMNKESRRKWRTKWLRQCTVLAVMTGILFIAGMAVHAQEQDTQKQTLTTQKLPSVEVNKAITSCKVDSPDPEKYLMDEYKTEFKAEGCTIAIDDSSQFLTIAGTPAKVGDYKFSVIWADTSSEDQPEITVDYVFRVRKMRNLTIKKGQSVPDKKTCLEGDVISIVADEPEENYDFDDWTGGKGGTFADEHNPSTTFTMPDADTTITATYKKEQTYTLTVKDGTDNTGGEDYREGDTVSISADPAPEGSVFKEWENDGSGTIEDPASATTTYTMPPSDATVKAAYEKAQTLEFQLSVVNGTDNTNAGPYQENAQISISAAEAPGGQTFREWTSSNGGSFADSAQESTTFTMPAGNVTLTAAYEAEAPKTYTLTMANGTDNTMEGPYVKDTKVSITAAALPEGQKFKEWISSNGGTFEDSKKESTNFSMPAGDATVTATYEALPKFNLTVAGGTDNTKGSPYLEGTKVSITAASPEGQKFKEWTSSNGGSFEDSKKENTNFSMPAGDVTVTAVYEVLPKYTLTMSSGTDNTKGSPYLEGTKVSITAAAAPVGEKFKEWTSNNGGTFEDSKKENTTFTMPAGPVIVTATYEALTYTITAAASPPEAGTVTGAGKVMYHTKTTLTATAKTGYKFSKWTEGNQTVGTEPTLAVENVDRDHAYVAEFTKTAGTASSAPTGDKNNIAKWIAIMAVAVVGVIIVLIVRKKKR